MNESIWKASVEKILELSEPISDSHWRILKDTQPFRDLENGSGDIEGVAYRYEFILKEVGGAKTRRRRAGKQAANLQNLDETGLEILPLLVWQEASADPIVQKIRFLWGGTTLSSDEARDWLRVQADQEFLRFCELNPKVGAKILGAAFERKVGQIRSALNKHLRVFRKARLDMIRYGKGILLELRNAQIEGVEQQIQEFERYFDFHIKRVEGDIAETESLLKRLSGRSKRLQKDGSQDSDPTETVPDQASILTKDDSLEILGLAHEVAKGWPNEDRTWVGLILLLPPEGKSVVQPYYEPNGLLHQLDEASNALAKKYGWNNLEALSFLVTGSLPRILQLDEAFCHIEEHPGYGALSRIVMRIDPQVSPRRVMEAYVAERTKLIKHARPLTPKHRAMGWFLGQPSVKALSDWRKRMAIWNDEMKEFPDSIYSNPAIFRRDAEAARRRLLKPKKTQTDTNND